MRVHPPCPALAPFIREHMIVEVDADVTRLRLPEPGLVLGLRYRGSAGVLVAGIEERLPDASLAALTNVARRMRTHAGGGVALVHFRPGGAAAFFRQPLHELFGQTLALEDLLPRADVARAGQQIGEASDDGGRIAAMESFLLRLLRPREEDRTVIAAVDALTRSRGSLPIRSLARRLAVSQDRLEKRFRAAVGATPKQFASLLRLRHAIDSYRPGTNLAHLAQASGYFDQAHFSRALRATTGLSPRRFFGSAEER